MIALLAAATLALLVGLVIALEAERPWRRPPPPTLTVRIHVDTAAFAAACTSAAMAAADFQRSMQKVNDVFGVSSDAITRLGDAMKQPGYPQPDHHHGGP